RIAGGTTAGRQWPIGRPLEDPAQTRPAHVVMATAGFSSVCAGVSTGRTTARGHGVADDRGDFGVLDERLVCLLRTPQRGQSGPHAQNQHERSPHCRLLRKFPPLRGGRYLRFSRTNRFCFSFRFSARPGRERKRPGPVVSTRIARTPGTIREVDKENGSFTPPPRT